MADGAGHATRRFPWLDVGVGVLAFLILIGLGTWQVERLRWKEGLIATIDERMHAEPQPLAAMEARFAEQADVDYWAVAARGEFLHAAERHFLATHKGRAGFFVYTPLRLSDGRAVFVNRGFVPYDLKDPAKRPEGQVQGQVEVTGLARNPLREKPSSILPDNDPARNIFYWKDIAAMTATAGLPAGTEVVPFFIDAGDAPVPGGWPVGGVTLVDLPNSHLQYALTWYGLALALLGVGIAWFRHRLKGGGSPPLP